MASYNLYDGSVAYFVTGMHALSHILKKAEEHCKEKGIPEKEIIEARLIDDMLPLSFQIQTASNTSKKALPRLLGTEDQPMEDKETTFAELQARIAKTLEILNSVTHADFDSMNVEEEIKVKIGGNDVPFTKKSYVQRFAVPNFYFHVVTAYAILRMKGVPIGKTDFLRPPQA